MDSIVPHIKIEQHPNPEMRTYHVTRQISKVHSFRFGVDRLIISFGEEENPGQLGKRMAKALERIPGVCEGSVDGYAVDITKGAAFEWSDVSPLVLGQIVKRVFPKSIGETIAISTTVNYIVGDYGRSSDIARHCEVPVQFSAKEQRPRLDVEELFSSPTLTKVSTEAPATEDKTVNEAGTEASAILATEEVAGG